MNDERINNEDKNIEIFMGNLLRTGVIIAGLIVITGAILFLIRYGFQMPHYSVFKGELKSVDSLINILKGVFKLNSIAIIQFGIIILIATPVLRVLFSVFAFIYEKDLMYVIFTLIVLAVLIISLFV